MVDLRPQLLFVIGGTDGSIGHGATDAHFGAACGHASCYGGLFRQIRSRDGKLFYIVQFCVSSVVPCQLAVNDALCAVDAPVDGHGSTGA